MYINNPQKGIKFIDLLDYYDENFSYNKIYNIMNDYLLDIKDAFFINDVVLWNNFIVRFCDRFYNRELNFETFLEFKLKLKECLNRHKMETLQLYKASLKEIDPLITENITTEHHEKNKHDDHTHNLNVYKPNLETKTDNTTYFGGITNVDNDAYEDKNTSSGSDTTSGYNLHSDTPSSTVNVKDIASGSKDYITDAQNDKHKTEFGKTDTFKGGKRHNKTVNSGDDRLDGLLKQYGNATNDTSIDIDNSHAIDYNHIVSGYTGSPVDLLEKYSKMVFDAMTYLLDCIDNDAIFSRLYL